MKYNKEGQRFIIDKIDRIEGVTVDGSKVSGGTFWVKGLLDDLQLYIEPKSPRWIDGAVQLPKVGDVIDWWCGRSQKIEHEAIYRNVKIKDEAHAKCFKDVQWILSSNFPMPEEPEKLKVIIENCLYCGGKCLSVGLGQDHHDRDVFCVTCDGEDCRYYSAQKLSEEEAIEAHNKLYRRLK